MQEVQSVKTSFVHCLDCRIERRQIAVSLTYVDQLIQYVRTPLPLSVALVGGLGIYEDSIVISICLRSTLVLESKYTKAVVLRGLPGRIPWALEVDETLSFIEVAHQEHPHETTCERWLTPATSQAGQTLVLLDVERLTSSLALARVA